MSTLEGHYKGILMKLARNEVVPFLGANINLCGRPEKTTADVKNWEPNGIAPSNQELAIYLDEQSGHAYRTNVQCPFSDVEDLPTQCPLKEGRLTRMALQHVSQYIGSKEQDLRSALQILVYAEYRPNPIHKFFAYLPKIMREKGYYPPYPLIVTTCFDRTLERAFDTAGESYDLIYFVMDNRGGRFAHRPPGKEPRLIESANTYEEASFADRPVILKLYGDMEKDFVITEDHYIDYLSQRDITEQLPANLLARLQPSALRQRCIWFLGYSPSYWNLRVILHRIWPEQMLGNVKQAWEAVLQPPFESLDESFWQRYGGSPVNVPSLEEYISELDSRVRKLSAKKAPIPQPPDPQLQPSGRRNQVFISYSHEDTALFEKLQKMISPALRAKKLSLWADTKIEPGAKWREEIKSALAAAKVAVLLVSKDFLNSDFIAQEELPYILEAAKKEGVKIIWICLTPCLYQGTEIEKYQAAHTPQRPLNTLSEPEQEEVLVDICNKIIEAANA